MHPIPSQSKLDEPNQEVDQSSRIIATQVLIAAEGALKHISSSGRKAKIKEAFLNLQIEESQYTVLVGFNEDLIRPGFRYLEEIHMFCSVEVPNSQPLLITLGKILSPYPGIIFTPLSGYKTPVFKDDGTIWDYNDLCLHRAETHSKICIKENLCSKLNASTIGGQPSINVTASGCSEEGGNSNHGGAGEDKGRSSDNNSDHRNPGDDPEHPEDAGNGDSLSPGISFDVQAKLFEGTGNSSPSKPFQVLEINGTLVVQTIPGQSKPKRILFKSHAEFSKLKFQSTKFASLAYEQVYVEVEIDTKEKNTQIDVHQPFKTRASDKEYPSRITNAYGDGAVSWGFFVDDVNERQTGIGFGRYWALPSVDFTFYGTEDFGPPQPPPKYFDVLAASCWSLIPGNKGYTTSGWLSLLLKRLGPGTTASKSTLYSNLCQVVLLEVPSDLSAQATSHKFVSEINQGRKTGKERAGLCKIAPTVLFLGGLPINSGNSYGPSSLQQ